MIQANRTVLLFGVMALLLLLVCFVQSWSLALAILNLCLISAVMSLGVNIQWGYAGLFNVGVMGFAALGGLAGVLVSTPPVHNAIAAGGGGVLLTGAIVLVTIAAVWFSRGFAHSSRAGAEVLMRPPANAASDEYS